MDVRQESRAGATGAIRERLWLFAVLAASLLLGALSVTKALITPPSIEARIRTEIIELGVDGEDPASLVRPAPIDADGLRNALLATSPSETESTQTPLSDAGWRERLTVVTGDETGAFAIRLSGDDEPETVDAVNGLIAAFIEGLNRRRAEQKDEALAWIEKSAEAWRARIDEAKGAILRSPFDPDLTQTGGRTASERLLRQMIDAMTDAKSGSEAGANGPASDEMRLRGVLTELEAGRAAQLEHGSALKEAEAGLTQLHKESAEIIAEGGVLDRPAAVILAAASVVKTGLPTYLWAIGWPALVPAYVVLSMVLALIGTVAACWIWPPAEVAAEDYLNDPNWPLPADAKREL